jgi:uncharacterized protein (TIGR03435 family)
MPGIVVGVRALTRALSTGALLIALGLQVQTQPAFEVVSVRRNLTGLQRGGGLAAPQPGGRFIAIGATLKRLVGDAYDGMQVFGGPSWIDTDRFDVNARAENDRSPDEIRRMLRPMLADRFRLVVHAETREMPIYVLSTARADRTPGPRLRESDASCTRDARAFVPSGTPGSSPSCGDFRLGARTLTARGMSMGSLARLLRDRVGRPVIDRTGLGAAYDLDIEWSSDLGLQQAPPDAAGTAELASDGLSLFTALREQLGLSLQASRGPVEVIVVDHADPPNPD